MGGEWRSRPLGELVDNFDGRRIPVKEADRRPGPYPYYGASGVVDYVDSYIFDGEYLLIAEDGENLRTRSTPVAFLARGRFWVNNHAHIVRGNSEADTRFLMYALSGSDISGYLTGSTMPKLTQGNMNRVPLRTPPLCEQIAIASILGAFDDKIELNRRTSETLEAMARALFRSWFVDFDPVRAKMEGREARLRAEIAALFPQSFEDSDRGEVPRGWRSASVREVVAVWREQINPLDSPDEPFAHFSIPAFDGRRNPIIERGEGIRSNKFVVPPGAILLSKLNPEIERVWAVDVPPDVRSVCSTEFLVLRPKSGYDRAFAYAMLRSRPFRVGLESLVTGTSKSHQRAQPGAILGLEVVLPSPEVIAAFGRVVAPMLDRVRASRAESGTLAALRDALLPKLISGELRVKDAERMVGNSV